MTNGRAWHAANLAMDKWNPSDLKNNIKKEEKKNYKKYIYIKKHPTFCMHSLMVG